MLRPAAAALASLFVATVTAAPGPARAEETWPPASEWRGYCQAYLQALDGGAKGNDLDVTYCLGTTKGLLNGLRVGSQVGALSFGSRLAVKYQLDADEVFKEFQRVEPSLLMGVCAPAGTSAADFVRAVMSHLERNPADLQQPIGEVFFEGLQLAWPCS
jgi:Rap1a immunity proteins